MAQLEPVKRTPAGVPKQRIWIEHRSRQMQLGQAREVQARLAVVLIGDEMVQRGAQLKQGVRIRVEGFLARAGFKGEAQDRLELHAVTLNSLD